MFSFDSNAMWVTLDYKGPNSDWQRMGIRKFAKLVGLEIEKDGNRHLVRDPDAVQDWSMTAERPDLGRAVAVSAARFRWDVFVWAIPDPLPENSEKASTP